MTKNDDQKPIGGSPVDLSDNDILAAMKKMQGYIDITPADFQEIYRFAFNHAVDRIAHSIRARDIMSREVISVTADTPLTDTAEKMALANISGVPVIDKEGKVIGVISEKDFLRRMGASRTDSFMGVISDCLRNKGCVVLPIRGKVAGDIMTAPAITVDPDRTLSEISEIMSNKKINRAPVTDRENRLVGIVSRGDIVNSQLLKICG